MHTCEGLRTVQAHRQGLAECSYCDYLYAPHFAAEQTGSGRGRSLPEVPQLAWWLSHT